jgi:hypothetical protein
VEKRLDEKIIGVLICDGVDAGKLSSLTHAIRQAGGKVAMIGPEDGQAHSWNPSGWGESIQIDEPLEDVHPERFDGLVVPGGPIAADHLRGDHNAVDLVRKASVAIGGQGGGGRPDMAQAGGKQPEDAILFARTMGPAELLDYERVIVIVGVSVRAPNMGNRGDRTA